MVAKARSLFSEEETILNGYSKPEFGSSSLHSLIYSNIQLFLSVHYVPSPVPKSEK